MQLWRFIAVKLLTNMVSIISTEMAFAYSCCWMYVLRSHKINVVHFWLNGFSLLVLANVHKFRSPWDWGSSAVDNCSMSFVRLCLLTNKLLASFHKNQILQRDDPLRRSSKLKWQNEITLHFLLFYGEIQMEIIETRRRMKNEIFILDYEPNRPKHKMIVYGVAAHHGIQFHCDDYQCRSA